MTENFNIDYKKNNGELTIVFSGQLTISSVKKITESLKANIENPEKVLISVKDVENLDLTFVQLIQSIKNSGKKNGYEVSVSMKLPEDLSSLLVNGGFGNLLQTKEGHN
jgi:ABC-type transporter Mla MlaB component